MYFFGLSKEEVLSRKYVVTYKEACKKKPVTVVTLFGRQVYPAKSESSKSGDGYRSNNSSKLMMKDIDLRLPANHYAYSNFLDSGLKANKANEALSTNWSGKRNTKIVIDLEEPATTEHVDSVSYVTVRTKPSKMVDQSLVDGDTDKTSSEEKCLLDLNSTPADELVSEPRFCFLQDLNCPYIEETETSCEKSGIDDGTTPLCSPTCNEKDGTASPASYTSCCTTENNSTRTESRRSSSPRELVEPSCRTMLEFPASKVLPEEEEEEELSEMTQMAAESLVHISAVSHQNQHFQSKPASRTNSSSQDRDLLEKTKAKRGCSCDSYELLILGIKETNSEEEDLCVSSMAIDDLNNIKRDNNNKEIGLKLKRGRRMKNFQKEILPSLTSLSRLEIREDINILEAVLRSREYKKIHGKTKDVKFRANTKNKHRNVGKKRRKTE